MSHCPQHIYTLISSLPTLIQPAEQDIVNKGKIIDEYIPLSKDQSIIESEDILDNLRKNAEGDDKEFVDVIQRQAVNSRNQATFFSTVYSHFPQSSEGDILLNCITNNVADLVEALQRHPDPSYTILAIPIAVLLSPPTQQVQNSVNVLPRLSSLLPRPSLRLHVIQLLLTLTQSLPPPASPMFTEYLHAYLTNLLGFSDSHFIETHHSLVPVLQLQHLQNTRLSKGLQTSAELCSSFAFTSTLHTLFNIVPPAKIFSHAFLTSYVTSLCTLCMQQYLQSVNSRTISPFTEADSFIQTMLSVFASSSSPDSPQPILPSSFALLKTIRQYHLCLKNATTSLPHVSSGDRSLVTLIFPQTHLYEQQPFDMATTYLTHLLSTPHSLLSPQILLLFHNFADALNKPKDNIPFITASSLRQLTSLWQLFLSNKTNSFAPEDQTAIGHIRAVLLESLPRSLSISR
ncbi:hypothetical protein BLNAU_7907 [Blattamonas nauphoetae]|uniref:Uncharacterized protein n=1 Tax=Blattamonas nauphoetae TaxID=2049346 RepID=A0ABQ9Y000_9EUKA|nr:hypothetical protein BLNAU_7907 [Blattamonas nauphoetae]